jgi:hypothetical protein
MSRVTLTINLELDMPGLPSCEALGAAMQRAESAAARVFVCGGLGGKMKVDVESSANPIPKTCDTVDILPGRMGATVGRRKRKRDGKQKALAVVLAEERRGR